MYHGPISLVIDMFRWTEKLLGYNPTQTTLGFSPQSSHHRGWVVTARHGSWCQQPLQALHSSTALGVWSDELWLAVGGSDGSDEVGSWWVRFLHVFFGGILVWVMKPENDKWARESTWGHQNPEIEGTFFFCVPSLTRADELRWQVLHFAFFLMSWCNYDFCHTHDPVAVSGSTEKYWKHDAPEVFAILRLEHIEIC